MIFGVFVYCNVQALDSKDLSDFALNNVEALAGEDWGFDCRWADRDYDSCVPFGAGLGCPCYM